MAEIPRLAPAERLPPYAFVPGQFPHPFSDPAGHSHGLTPVRSSAPDPEQWFVCQRYLFGLDLFNRGYYWEAHEQWEGLWLACGRQGKTATFLKGLIQLAAAGVKARQLREPGVRGHARRAAELFQEVAAALGPLSGKFMGLSVATLAGFATGLAKEPLLGRAGPAAQVEVVFPLALVPSDD